MMRIFLYYDRLTGNGSEIEPNNCPCVLTTETTVTTYPTPTPDQYTPTPTPDQYTPTPTPDQYTPIPTPS